MLVIQGARQVGKSTFAQVLVDGRGRLLTLDEPAVLAAARLDPVGFVAQLPDGILVIDEIQRMPELVLPIKAAVDRSNRPGQFILTGSADLLRIERTPETLAGRAVSLDLFGLSQGELLGRRDDFIGAVLGGLDAYDVRSQFSRSDYVDVLAQGGFPEIRDLQWTLRRTWLEGYLQRIVQRDADDVRGRVAPERLMTLLRLVAANQAGELVGARMAQASEIPATTLPSYLDLAEALFIVRRIPPWTSNLTKRQVGRSKAVITDSALAMMLAGLTPQGLKRIESGEHFGSMLEGFVVGELLRQRGWSDVPFRVQHFRDRDGHEVDIVIDLDDGRAIGIEVKAAAAARSEHFKGLRLMQERLGDRFVAGIVLGTGGQGQSFGPRMMSLPVSALWERD